MIKHDYVGLSHPLSPRPGAPPQSFGCGVRLPHCAQPQLEILECLLGSFVLCSQLASRPAGQDRRACQNYFKNISPVMPGQRQGEQSCDTTAHAEENVND